MTVCFIDTETTALDRDVRQVWEVALITAAGVEYVWNLPVDLSTADPMSLAMNGFGDRYGHKDTPEKDRPAILRTFVQQFAALTRGQHLVGACVNFDEVSLWKLLRDNGECPMWHYHIVDVEALAAGYLAGLRADAAELPSGEPSDAQMEHGVNMDLARPPWKSVDLSRAVGVEPEDFERHSALGDAKWARAVYFAVMGGA